MDIGRAPYTCRARLYPDDATEYELNWYICRDDAPLLGSPSAVNILEWENDREEWLETSVGEVPYTREPTTDWDTRPLATGVHRCGDDGDFAGDGEFDPSPPYVDYRPDGLPTCCAEALEARGGGKGGGVAAWTWTPDPVGLSCCDAGLAALGATYTGLVPLGLSHIVHYRYAVSAGNYTATWDLVPGVFFGSYLLVETGPACDNTPTLLVATTSYGTYAFTVATDGVLCVAIEKGSTIPSTYTLVVESVP